ncbi:MAG: sulfurtransferase TusA family protein [Clostridia bacterium]
MDIVDCFGDMCPIPMIKIEIKLKTMEPGEEFMLVTDHSCTITSVLEKYSHQVTKVEEVMLGVWEVSFKK